MFTRKLSFTKPTYPKARAMGITKFPYYEYDSNGNLSYYENYLDEWEKYEFDSNSNEIYRENHTGYWMITEFDSNSNETYYKDGYKETLSQGK